MEYLQTLKQMLDVAIKEEASDLLISVGHPPMIRVTGQLLPVLSEKNVTPEMAEGLASALLGEDRKKKFLAEKEIDLSYDFDGKARFRVNIFFQRESISLALRLIPSAIKTIENLSFPAIL
ncbi:type IV pili twitching motility protein PilT, partial [Candidatus Parcubacteria bacterium]|nr:type IV pili twitching motility protein PilT [Candidatus Parcubacteria bacterium]